MPLICLLCEHLLYQFSHWLSTLHRSRQEITYNYFTDEKKRFFFFNKFLAWVKRFRWMIIEARILILAVSTLFWYSVKMAFKNGIMSFYGYSKKKAAKAICLCPIHVEIMYNSIESTIEWSTCKHRFWKVKKGMRSKREKKHLIRIKVDFLD